VNAWVHLRGKVVLEKKKKPEKHKPTLEKLLEDAD